MISIIMAVHNRKVQLHNTLKSIDYFKGTTPIEVIIVDETDEEGEEIGYLADCFDYPIYILPVVNKSWVCSCMPYNIGFSKASGSTIIIQNAECLWTGNVLKYVKEHSHKGLYITFGAYSVDRWMGEIMDFGKEKDELKKMVYTASDTYPKGRSGWFNHSLYRPCKFHFCSAISRSDLEEISGFDERYADGYAFDDAEILVRIENAGIETVIVDEPFVIHQWHPNQGAAKVHPLWERNNQRYQKTLKEGLIKSPNNIIYAR